MFQEVFYHIEDRPDQYCRADEPEQRNESDKDQDAQAWECEMKKLLKKGIGIAVKNVKYLEYQISRDRCRRYEQQALKEIAGKPFPDRLSLE
jgi:hypothetical protein